MYMSITQTTKHRNKQLWWCIVSQLSYQTKKMHKYSVQWKYERKSRLCVRAFPLLSKDKRKREKEIAYLAKHWTFYDKKIQNTWCKIFPISIICDTIWWLSLTFHSHMIKTLKLPLLLYYMHYIINGSLQLNYHYVHWCYLDY